MTLPAGGRSVWWCEHAALVTGVAHRVTIEVADGRFTSIVAGTEPPGGATRLPGLTLPAFANAHSHAFQRALRSRVQAERGSFWTWRETMYRAAGRLDPDRYHRLARAVFAEMASAGFTVVGEFHYVHHGPDGTPYAEPNAMGQAVLAAADEAGIRITLLDTLYLHAGIGPDGHRPAEGVQRRFADASVDAWLDRVDRLVATDTQVIGAAIHSVRAVDPASMTSAAEWATAAGSPLHAHVSEQPAENERCLARFGRTPTELLDSCGALDAPFTAVHATHLTDHDVHVLGAHEVTIAMCPTTEQDLGDGIGPTSELVAAGARLAIGSDSHAVVDPFVEARAVELDERLRSGRRGIHAADELLRAATRAGHVALGWDDAGEIAVGRRADLVTISTSTERTAGAPDEALTEAAMFAATAADVTSVVADGRQVVVGGRHAAVDVPAELAGTIGALLR